MIQFLEYSEATKDTGGIITVPGAYLNVPMSVYHGQPTPGFSVSSSGLRTIFIDSLRHFWNGSALNPNRPEFKQTEPIILGRAGHHLFLGEANYNSQYIVQPEKAPDGRAWNGNNLSCQQWLADRRLEGMTVVTRKQVEQLRGMAAALAADEVVQSGILNGHVEVSLFWQDAETGIWLKSRPDNIPTDSADAADLKCVANVSNDGIAKALGERGYHQQGAMVGEAFRNVLDIEMELFTLVYVEADQPHCVRCDPVAPEEIAAGAAENRAALRLLKRALDTNYWPGPKSRSGDGGYVRRTSYAKNQAAARLLDIEADLAA